MTTVTAYCNSAMVSAFLVVASVSPASAGRKFWTNGDFEQPIPVVGGFSLVDVGVRYGEWRVVGEAGNVMWVNGAYTHDGFSFSGPNGTNENWVNLAAISRTATGLVHEAVATKKGQPYTLTFYVGNLVDPNGYYGSSSTVKVYENSKDIGSFTNSNGAGSTSETWKVFSVTFEADADWTSVAFINGDGPKDMNCGIADTLLSPGVETDRPQPSAHSVGRGR